MNEPKILAVGDVIAQHADRYAVVVVSEHAARILNAAGNVEIIMNPMESCPLQDLLPKGALEGSKEMNLFLNLNAGKREELTKPISVEEDEEMKTKKSEAYKNNPRGGLAAQKVATKTPKAPRAPKTPKAPKPPKAETRSSYTRALAHIAHNSVEEIQKLAKAKYPTSDMSTTKRLVADERAKIAKAK